MSEGYLKRYVAPKSWTLLRKTTKYVIKSNPGAHSMNMSMPIALWIRQLGYAKTAREIKKILRTKEILVDKKRVKESKFPVGFMDVLSIPTTKEKYRIALDCKGKLKLLPITNEAEENVKICRIDRKTKVKGGKNQLNMSGNRNLLIEKDDYRVGDSLLLDLPSQKILRHLKLEPGALIFVTGGTRVGNKGIVEKIEKSKITYATEGEKRLTLKDYAFVIGKDKEEVNIG